jgi:type II secretory pathway pseudopilin PulG
MRSGRAKRDGAFTLLELLAVIATISTLAALLLPVLGKAKTKALQANCSANVHQLGLAWRMYQEDNAGWLVESYPFNNSNVWVLGDMTRANEATNSDLIKAGKLFQFSRNVSIYRCPADPGVDAQGKRVINVRSYSMNSFMGARPPGTPIIPTSAATFVPYFAKESDIPKPSENWVFVDEDSRSINDGFFIVDPTAHIWFDFPALSVNRHNYGFSMAFADGHSEVWHSHDVRSQTVDRNETEQAGNTDLSRLARGAASPK